MPWRAHGPGQSAGRPRGTWQHAPRGKSGLHGTAMPDNIRRGRPQGQRHRDRTARPTISGSGGQVRVKRCGKSAPRTWQQGRHGKPHREQDRIGMTRCPQGRQACSGPVIRVGCSRCLATGIPEEWPSRQGQPWPSRTRLTGRLAPSMPPASCSADLCRAGGQDDVWDRMTMMAEHRRPDRPLHGDLRRVRAAAGLAGRQQAAFAIRPLGFEAA